MSNHQTAALRAQRRSAWAGRDLRDIGRGPDDRGPAISLASGSHPSSVEFPVRLGGGGAVGGHVAAASGCPTWILLPFTPDFRWLLGRDDSPWYPTVRLFRQDERRDYAEVLARVGAELEMLMAAYGV